MEWQISKKKAIHASVEGLPRFFERAISLARTKAYMEFGIDEDGHADVDEWERCNSWMVVEFNGFTVTGDSYNFKFTAWCMKNDD